MADNPTQDGRIGKLATPLGKDKLCLTRFEGTEAIGELFEYRIEAVSPDSNLNFKGALGKTCSVQVETTDRVGRDFSGILTEAKWVGMRFNLPLYRVVLRPWPWILSLRSHCRIFAKIGMGPSWTSWSRTIQPSSIRFSIGKRRLISHCG